MPTTHQWGFWTVGSHTSLSSREGQVEIEVQELLMHRQFSRLGGVDWKISVPERRNQVLREEGKLAKQTDKEI